MRRNPWSDLETKVALAQVLLGMTVGFGVAAAGADGGDPSAAESKRMETAAPRFPAIVEPERRSSFVRDRLPRRVAASQVASCEEFYSAIETQSSGALVAAIRRADPYCIDELRWLEDRPELQAATSSERHVTDVANAIPNVMESYGSDRVKDEISNLFLYLEVAGDIHHWCRTEKQCDGAVWETAFPYRIDAGSVAGGAVRSAFDSFVRHTDFLSNEDEHGEVVATVARAIGLFRMEELYLHALSAWLGAWEDLVYGQSPVLRDAMERLLDLSYWGNVRGDDGFGQVFGDDAELFGALSSLAHDASLLGTLSQRILERSVVELARFSYWPGTSNYERLPETVDAMRRLYAGEARGKAVWLRFAGGINLLREGGDCDRYDLCQWGQGDDFFTRFREELFSSRMACPATACAGDTVTLHSQALTSRELGAACRRLDEQSDLFHSMFSTQCRPVADDRNTHLDYFIYADDASCEDLDGVAFPGADTCTGLYFEGNPSDASDGVSAITTEKEPDHDFIDPELAIWNFEHEYAHYLDGRFNLYGGYTGDPRIEGWSEGFAEYFAKNLDPYHFYASCSSSHSLTETLLRSGSIPTSYNQRHLAIRFLMEKRRPFVDGFLEFLREGRWDEFEAWIGREAPGLEAEFERWLARGCKDGSTLDPRIPVETLPDLNLHVGQAVDMVLPAATGGDPPLMYGLETEPPARLDFPAGLSFDPFARRLSGTTTWPYERTLYAYSVTDSDPVDPGYVALRFTIAVDLEAKPPDPEPPPGVTCVPDTDVLCLYGGRYEVRVDWWTADGDRGAAQVVPKGMSDSGLFWFFDPENWEVLIKVLDGCAVNGHQWVYGASTTDLGYSVRVTDTTTGDFKEYRNERGRPAPAITDAKAFPNACGND